MDVWLVRLDVEDHAGVLLAALSPDERTNAARRRTGLDAQRYAVGRASLRTILGRYLGVPAADLRFRTEPRGRPVLDQPTNLSFSVAHSGEIGLVAVSCTREVGIDVESLSAAGVIAEIADRYLPAGNLRTIRAGLADKWDEEYVGLWTQVEACAKVDGRGLGDLNQTSAAALLNRNLHVVRFGPTEAHIGTLAYTGNAACLTYYSFESGIKPGGEDSAPSDPFS